MRILSCCVLRVVVLVMLCSAAQAARLEELHGKVSVNRGSGFELVTGATVLNVGDAVMASPDASARIAYADGCAIPVKPGIVTTVAAQSPCSSQSEWSPPAGLGGCSLKDDSSSCRIEPEIDRTHLIVGGLLVAGGVTAAILLTQDHGHSP